MWTYDFLHDRTESGAPVRMLTVVDEYSRECLAITVGRRLRSADVIDMLADLFVERGAPEFCSQQVDLPPAAGHPRCGISPLLRCVSCEQD